MVRSCDHYPRSKGQRSPSEIGKSKRAVGPHRPIGGRGRATRPTAPSNVGALRLAPHAGGEWRGTHQVGVCGVTRRERSTCRVEAALGPQSCASATTSNDKNTILVFCRRIYGWAFLAHPWPCSPVWASPSGMQKEDVERMHEGNSDDWHFCV